MEVFGARPTEATEACLEEISEFDALVGIYAHRYGFVPQGDCRSITEQEFDHARKNNKPLFCFLIDEDYPWLPKHVETEPGHTSPGIRPAHRREFVTDKFTIPQDLAFKVASSLGRFLLYSKVKDSGERLLWRTNRYCGRPVTGCEASLGIATIIRDARVLLVNDNPREMWHVINIMKELGLDVHVATSTEDALSSLYNSALSKRSFHAVISDMQRGVVADEGINFIKKDGGRRHASSCYLYRRPLQPCARNPAIFLWNH